MRAFLFLFLLFPLIELAVLIQVGSAIGVLPTLLLVIATAVLGSVLLRVAVASLRAGLLSKFSFAPSRCHTWGMNS